MTRSITTAAELDALPVGAGVVDKHGDLGLIDRGVMRGALIVRYAETDVMSVRRAARYLPMTVVHDPSEARPESAHVVPVVSDAAVSRGLAQSAAGETVDLGDFTQYLIPDAAVEAGARALRIEEVGDSAPPGFAARQWDIGETPREKPTRLARSVLSAALPLLGAAPSAEQCGAWGGCSLPHGHNLGRADIPMNHRVPSATREDVAGIINDAAFEGVEHGRAERVAAYLHARFTITPRTDR